MSARAAQLPFKVPNEIKRSKTALLKALSSTVGVDKTAPHFAFIDDPLTIPTSTYNKRSYFITKEFGKRAARQLAEEWPTLFMLDRDEPRLPIFRPENLPRLAEMEQPTPELIKKLLDGRKIEDALRVYEKVRAAKVNVSPELLQKMFELAAYYNGRDPPVSENVEWAGLRNYFEDNENVFVKSGVVELFSKLVEQTPENLSIIITCKAKYGDHGIRLEAYKLLVEMVKNKKTPLEDAFIALMRVEQKFERGLELLKMMADSGVTPSIRTFNALITCANHLLNFDKRWEETQKILAEAYRLGVKPSLTTYNLVLSLLRTKKENEKSDLSIAVTALNECLNTLEEAKSIDIQEHTDQEFFLTAISIAVFANNSSLVNRIEAIQNSPKNKVKLTALTVETTYYSRYLNHKIFAELTDLNEIEKIYLEMVPRLVGVNKATLFYIFDKLPAENPPWSLMKRLLEDTVTSRLILDTRITQTMLRFLLSVDLNILDIGEVEQFRALMVRINNTWLELAGFTEEWAKSKQIKLRPSIVVPVTLLLLRTGERSKAFSLIDRLVEADRETIVVEARPTTEHLLLLFDEIIDTHDIKQASNVLELISRYTENYNLDKLSEKIISKFSLNETQKRVINNFVKLRL